MAEFNREKAKQFMLLLGDVLDHLHIPFMLLQGTALGAYRDHDFVPTERDIDLGILIEYFAPAVPEIAAELIRRGIEVETWHRHRPWKFCHTLVAYADGAKADLVGLMKWKLKRFTVTPDDPVNVLEPYAIVHPSALLERYQQVELFGRQWHVPRPIELYLEREYGEEWRTPAEDHVSRTRVYDFLKKEQVPIATFEP